MRKIFQAYLESGSIIKLKIYLDKEGCKTQRGCSFNRGGLYSLLTNPVYIGKIKHKKNVYNGQHPPIISQELWDSVQKKLTDTAAEGRGQKRVSQRFLLQGLLYDQKGVLYTPVFTSKGRQLYRYYVSRDKFEGKEDPDFPSRRYPAQEMENFIEKTIRQDLEDPEKLAGILAVDHALNYEPLQKMASKYVICSAEEIIRNIVRKIIIQGDSVTVEISPQSILSVVQQDPIAMDSLPEIYKIMAPFRMGKDLRYTVIIRPPVTNTPEDIFSLPPKRLTNLIRGIAWRDEHFRGMSIRGIARREKCDDTFVGRLIRESLEMA